MKRFLSVVITVLTILSLASCAKQDELLIHVISDVHYAPRDLYDYTGDFKDSSENNGTGKQLKYQEEIIDAYINEELENKPDYILITGDLVFSGLKENHIHFVDKFKKLIDNGIKVLIIPGNHDFDKEPFYYKDDVIHLCDGINEDEFKEIYQDFGYLEADSQDENSLSYSYKLNNSTYLIALDTIYKYGYTDGLLDGNTLSWIEERLKYAKKNNYDIIMMGHHNLYVHNELFEYGYRIENAEKLIELINTYNVKLYLSGHMHIQDIIQNNMVCEVLNESFAIYPHRYGELKISNHNFIYEAKKCDIESFSLTNNPDLLNYETYGYEFLFNNFYSQSIGKYDEINIDNETKELVKLEAKVNCEYFMGLFDDTNYPELKNSQVSGYITGLLKYLNKEKLKASGSLNN